jgi:hypothetical protein
MFHSLSGLLLYCTVYLLSNEANTKHGGKKGLASPVPRWLGAAETLATATP